MIAQRIHPPRSDDAKTSDNRLAVETTVAYLALPAPTLVARPDAVHVIVADSDDLGRWLYHLGGEVHRGPHTDDAALWTLRTETPVRGDGSKVAVRVHATVVDGDAVLVDVRRAVANV
ncbi:hypothetical protein [Streptomyces indicus]|uniref:Uncharacterized protein n=1 Tax=Streptomyces indicus TaxID=417292 RepID=A0A1G9J8N0_9ACTN|nr:hypothetical protein [Streptomyces indicus]SDL33910.1 hypothetical protein SAMN05421806_12852 [Streptomyces indicus]